MICVFCSIILQVEKIPPPTIIQIYCENGQKSSPTPIELVYFDNIGSLNHRTCSLCAPGNFVDFTQPLPLPHHKQNNISLESLSGSFPRGDGFYLDRIDGHAQTRLANRLDSPPKDSIRVDWLLFPYDWGEWSQFHETIVRMQIITKLQNWLDYKLLFLQAKGNWSKRFLLMIYFRFRF